MKKNYKKIHRDEIIRNLSSDEKEDINNIDLYKNKKLFIINEKNLQEIINRLKNDNELYQQLNLINKNFIKDINEITNYLNNQVFGRFETKEGIIHKIIGVEFQKVIQNFLSNLEKAEIICDFIQYNFETKEKSFNKILNLFKSDLYLYNEHSYASTYASILISLENYKSSLSSELYLTHSEKIEYLNQHTDIAINILDLIKLSEKDFNLKDVQNIMYQIKEKFQLINENKKDILLHLSDHFIQLHILYYLEVIQNLDTDIDLSDNFHKKSKIEQIDEINKIIYSNFQSSLKNLTENEIKMIKDKFNIDNEKEIFLILEKEFNKSINLFKNLYMLNINIQDIEQELTLINDDNINIIINQLEILLEEKEKLKSILNIDDFNNLNYTDKIKTIILENKEKELLLNHHSNNINDYFL